MVWLRLVDGVVEKDVEGCENSSTGGKQSCVCGSHMR